MGISNLNIDGLRVIFPYDAIYPEQVKYMYYLKQALDASHGQGLIEMPTGTGKTVTIMSLVTSYQIAHPEMGKLVYCTRTVPEMNQAIRELKLVIDYRDKVLSEEKPEEAPNRFLGIGLSARRNMCIHPDVAGQADRDKIDIKCREMTSNFIKKSSSSSSSSANRCSFFEGYDAAIGGVGRRDQDIEGKDAKDKKFAIPSGVYTLEDLRVAGGAEGWCPYYMTKRLLRHADVIVFNYQYVLDPRVSASALIAGESSRGAMSHGALAKEGEEKPAGLITDNENEQQFEPAVVIFDEAHNIDDICMDALTVTIDRRTIDRATSNVKRLQREVVELKKVDENRLKAEVENLMRGLAPSGGMAEEDESIRALKFGPNELKEAVSGVSHLVIPGNVRQAEHFLGILQQVCAFLRAYIRVDKARAEGPLMFLHELESQQYIEARTMKAFDARLRSLMNTLKITDIDEFSPLTKICDLCTLASLHSKGFAVLTDPCPEAEGIYDPQLELSCLDAAIAMRPVVRRYKNVVLTSGTLSPLSMYPRLLGLDRVVVSEALDISLERDCIRPLIVTRSNDIVLSSSFQSRKDEEVSKSYGTLLEELVQVVPDGVVCFFTSKIYMQQVIRVWYDNGTLARLSTHKVVFFETDDVVSTTIALSNYREACDQGRGGLFLAVARGKVSEGIDFDRHYGRAVVLFGVPFQYSLSRRLRARLAYIRDTHGISEGEFLTFDAMRAAAQCVGRVLRSKQDYGLMVLADARYARADKRKKLPPWIGKFLVPAFSNLTVDMAVTSAKEFLLSMSQPVKHTVGLKGGAEPTRLVGAKEAEEWYLRERGKHGLNDKGDNGPDPQHMRFTDPTFAVT
ncbi:General transcription and DNA repair factor IIH helicase subunit XPD [Perkinsus chesapeaki]|uniref:DNA 5'-3' helicase n=1 Tax=Perkinsus chesapeaki TaxID=330153 RepID=A0A7J6LY89_PERCH|nr:General transcription and DNA repair factor IIH helicase subunit XPD [Perkinsus chesapeaki]